jgi:peptidoglycan/xylan/chitin deacetylase (PgdA/CDA1 family)
MSGRLRRGIGLAVRALLHLLCWPWRPSAPRVLLWHSLDESGSIISTSPRLFARQMAWLARRGYETWPASRYVRALLEAAPMPRRLVVLTFDDGYANVLEHALPVLRAHGFCATVFLVTNDTGGTPRWEMHTLPTRSERLLTWSESQAMAREAIEVESHTHTHPRLREHPDRRVTEELRSSRVALRARGLGRGKVVAWPDGAYDVRLSGLARREGYVGGFLDDFSWSLRGNPDPFGVNRIPVNPHLGVFGLAFALGKGQELWSLGTRRRPTARA